jgi:hypothetical protein
MPNAFESVPLIWGYAILVLSIVLNGRRYNLESATLIFTPERADGLISGTPPSPIMRLFGAMALVGSFALPKLGITRKTSRGAETVMFPAP